MSPLDLFYRKWMNSFPADMPMELKEQLQEDVKLYGNATYMRVNGEYVRIPQKLGNDDSK